ncbi:hypothetical protein [Dactylosporangium sp. CA-139066]|uniref:hypothetical protein n=1 Tax=Dactylosporangium sp. CA-139066 TaxID=3239930 RepID=UPI003D9470F8
MIRPPLEHLFARASAEALRHGAVRPPRRHPGLVLGAAHGSAVHLALALGVPWQPLDGGWPAALDEHVAPSGTVVLVHGPRQVDRGTARALFDACRRRRLTAREVLYSSAAALSAAVADLYRHWLRADGRTGNRLVVECGRLVDPWNVLRAGLVPYWCREPTWDTVQELCWWLAGSEPFTAIEAFPEPPGAHRPSTAPLDSWRAAAAFATRRGVVDGRCTRRYPTGTVPPGHATKVLARQPYDLPLLAPLRPDDALGRLAGPDTAPGLLVR